MDYSGMFSLFGAIILWMFCMVGWMPYLVYAIGKINSKEWSLMRAMVHIILVCVWTIVGLTLLIWGYQSYSTRLYTEIMFGVGLFWMLMIGLTFMRRMK